VYNSNGGNPNFEATGFEPIYAGEEFGSTAESHCLMELNSTGHKSCVALMDGFEMLEGSKDTKPLICAKRDPKCDSHSETSWTV
jgi:hypothetical protein